ncbi:glyoxalase/bleomycin resistance/dioxygenase family protein [Pseudoclavibacter chungangensis]|uniref:Glyoxalase/bleomycin resistance/dioxygenase family protein n=1 Tax=Pseudoclavibacter chungangensis TaxID=587635 RepID=A0A7J5C1F4_9MICO|nr:VOC family protein [Pseudoclavibacter chungangensis]KAB1662291.1 glyoxalase/bleomycin resistance/dioxygenase family protein [Pseudoclavibacter chungangensis]NYJ65498.1 hypothetical protein [Pseudoclavibacter chungangensis]
MTVHWKLVVDCADATTLAAFWAAALEYVVEDPTPLIDELLAAGYVSSETVVDHGDRKTFRGFGAVRHPDDPFEAGSGTGLGRRILFQEVPERKVVKNRLHIDLHAEPGGRDALVERVESLGASRGDEVDQGPAGHWWVMRDPEGNEFCVS